jgi:hypothetical protein
VVADYDRVRRARGLIDIAGTQPLLCSAFQALAGDIVAGVMTGERPGPSRSTGHIEVIAERVSELVTVGHKLQWQLTQHLEGRLPFAAWVFFASLDVRVFFMLLRSTMDQAAAVVGHLVPEQRGCSRPYSSFHDLWKHADRDDGARCLGSEVTRLVKDAGWFPDVKQWRDSIEHSGSRLVVANDGTRPVFMIVRGKTFTLEIPEVMRGSNVVDFWDFAGLYVAYLLCFLDDLALLFRRNLKTFESKPGPTLGHPGLVFLAQAMDELAAKAPPPPDPQGTAS